MNFDSSGSWVCMEERLQAAVSGRRKEPEGMWVGRKIDLGVCILRRHVIGISMEPHLCSRVWPLLLPLLSGPPVIGISYWSPGGFKVTDAQACPSFTLGQQDT